MQKIILKWLKQKDNYVYCEMNANCPSEIFNQKLLTLHLYSRIHHDNLTSSPLYIVEQSSLKTIIEKYQLPDDKELQYQNFNGKFNEYVYYKILLYQHTKNITTTDSVQNRAIILDLINKIKLQSSKESKYVATIENFSLFQSFLKFFKEQVCKYQNDITNSLIIKEFDFEDFQRTYLDKINYQLENLEEIGIFFPFVINHDPYSKKHYLLEINNKKFQKNDVFLPQIIKNFYEKYPINIDKALQLITLEDYFAHPGIKFYENFAYFDPFRFAQKYLQEKSSYLIDFVSKKHDLQKFLHALFDILNEIQFNVVFLQHKNLDLLLNINRSKDRPLSLKDLIVIQIKQMSENPQFFKSPNLYVMKCFKKILDSNKIHSKTLDLEKFALPDEPDHIQKLAKDILAELLIYTEFESSLNHIFENQKKLFLHLIQEYHLNKKCEKILDNMIYDLMVFYHDLGNEKLINSLNSTFTKIFNEKQGIEFSQLVNSHFEEEFIKKYANELEIYKPAKLGKKYYMLF